MFRLNTFRSLQFLTLAKIKTGHMKFLTSLLISISFLIISCKEECCYNDKNGIEQCCEFACDFTDKEIEVLVATDNVICN